MRAIFKFTATGVLGLATIAAGVARASDGVMVTAPSRTWQAEYVYDPGANDQATQSVSVTRQLKFYFADATIDRSNPKAIAPNSDDNIREYLSSDVASAIQSAQTEADANNKKVADLLPKYLAKLRFKTVDCRQVTRNMIETLIGNRLKSTDEKSGPASLQYIHDQDQFDVAMTAKQFDAITVMRDPSIGDKDIDPRFTCRETRAGGTSALCGDLRIKFNPLEAQSGVFKGKKAVVFDADACAKFPEMDFASCELLVQVQRCGLRYSEKADGKRSVNMSTKGLADFLEVNRDVALREYEAGRPDVATQDAAASSDDQGAAGNAAFLGGFRSPNDPASSRPAD